VLTFALSILPFAGLVTVPLRLFSTFIHEAGHALAALLSFGSVKSLVVFPNGSGVTYTSGGWRFLISSAGYLGTTLFGVWMILSARRTSSARLALGLTGLVTIFLTAMYAGKGSAMPVIAGAVVSLGLVVFALTRESKQKLAVAGFLGLAACVVFGTFSYLWFSGGLLTWILGLGCGSLLLAAGHYTGGDVSKLVVAFLGVWVSLDALQDVFGLIGLSACSNAHTDAVNMSNFYAFPPIFWALLWSGIALVMVIGAVGYIFWEFKRQGRRNRLLP
jgi:hypothetical protein